MQRLDFSASSAPRRTWLPVTASRGIPRVATSRRPDVQALSIRLTQMPRRQGVRSCVSYFRRRACRSERDREAEPAWPR